jgi:hypothetical protein
VALVPVAFAERPTAVEATPVAAVMLQAGISKVPAVPEKHCAAAGVAPKTVTIPAAIDKPGSAPPAMALAYIMPARNAR